MRASRLTAPAVAAPAGRPSPASPRSPTTRAADPGLTVAWIAAPAWGTGSSGTYTVYRDTVPAFTPGPASEVATGISGTSWTDAGAPEGVTVYYAVRAENDESCGAGPNNGGLMDGNLVTASAVDVVGQAPPGDVGPTVGVDPANATDVRLSWVAVGDAATYNVYRSTMPDAGFAVIGQPTDPSYDDAGALDDGQSYYYRVTAVNACGGESNE